jgi:hypothetical protein
MPENDRYSPNQRIRCLRNDIIRVHLRSFAANIFLNTAEFDG